MDDLSAGLGLLDHGRTLGALDHVHGPTADHGASRCTGGQLRQGHSHGHCHFLIRAAEWRGLPARPRLFQSFPCHHTDQKRFKGQARYSPLRSVMGFGYGIPSGPGDGHMACARCLHRRVIRLFRDSGVENRLPTDSSSISRSLRNFIIKMISTTKCRSLAASGGTDYRRSGPSGGGSEDAVQSVAPTGPLGEWYGDGV